MVLGLIIFDLEIQRLLFMVQIPSITRMWMKWQDSDLLISIWFWWWFDGDIETIQRPLIWVWECTKRRCLRFCQSSSTWRNNCLWLLFIVLYVLSDVFLVHHFFIVIFVLIDSVRVFYVFSFNVLLWLIVLLTQQDRE